MRHKTNYRTLWGTLILALALFLGGYLLLRAPAEAAVPRAPTASFSVMPTSGAANTTVQFSGCD